MTVKFDANVKITGQWTLWRVVRWCVVVLTLLVGTTRCDFDQRFVAETLPSVLKALK